MQSLEMPDSHHLSSAIGWMELGLPLEAGAEVALISGPNQNHPDVLEVRWTLLAESGRWEQALEVARALVRVDPGRASGWLHQAYALRRAPEGGLQAAWDALVPAWEQFPRESIIPYNLSCYACQLKRPEEALDWLRRALRSGGPAEIKRMAMQDPDLAPLRAQIEQL
jgi:tetratricopeptide (TPR) repeat protein